MTRCYQPGYESVTGIASVSFAAGATLVLFAVFEEIVGEYWEEKIQ
jgi:hypothetical protein